MTDKPIILYMHAGSGNHGCEAIANSFIRMLNTDVDLISYYADEDNVYTLPKLCNIIQERSFNKHKIAHILYYIYRKITKDQESFIRYRFGKYLSKNDQSARYPIAVSIGGDNYCYDVMLNDLFLTNAAFNRQNTKTVLLGCSIEPDLVTRHDINEDLKKYHTIIARESITFDALKDAFGDNGPKIYCVPDPAFTLPVKKGNLPLNFKENNTVGINISPMIQDNEEESGITMKAYKSLIQYILDETDMNIALIPHVIWERNNDLIPIKELNKYFSDNGYSDRISVAEDADAETLKGIISRCRFFIGARTHATIAAYSTCVPTLVVGYSVKAKGIAKDLFPKYDIKSLVYPVQSLKKEDELMNAFLWIYEHEDQIRKHLESIMPEYINKAYEASKIVKEIV